MQDDLHLLILCMFEGTYLLDVVDFRLQHGKMYFRIFASTEGSNQPVHLCSLISLHCLLEALDPWLSTVTRSLRSDYVSVRSDQGHSGSRHKVHFSHPSSR